MKDSGRRWLELSVKLPEDPEAGALVTEALVGLGGRAVEERDGWLVTHLPEPDDPATFPEEARRTLSEETGLESFQLEVSWQDHEDWAESWRQGLAPRRIGDRLVVCPSWCEIEDPRPKDLVIVLDPGMAFGTAEHGTTRGCLRLLERAVEEGDRILDVGAGSGILSIGAALLGAGEIHAVEADALACEALEENVARNATADRVRWSSVRADSRWIGEAGPVEGVVANIECGVLEPLLPGFRTALPPDGWLILSGILAEEWAGLRAHAEDEGFAFEALDADGEWRSALFRRI